MTLRLDDLSDDALDLVLGNVPLADLFRWRASRVCARFARFVARRRRCLEPLLKPPYIMPLRLILHSQSLVVYTPPDARTNMATLVANAAVAGAFSRVRSIVYHLPPAASTVDPVVNLCASIGSLCSLVVRDVDATNAAALGKAIGTMALLDTLVLRASHLGPLGAANFASGWASSTVRMGPLYRLDLTDVGLGAQGLAAIVRVLPATVQTLCLSHNGIGTDGVCALAAAPSDRLAGIEHLHLIDNGIDDDGARALAAAPLPTLAYLDLRVNRIGPQCLVAIVATGAFPRLRTLFVDQRDVVLDGFRARHISRITTC